MFFTLSSLIVLSLGDLVVVTFSVEMSDSSDISSRSRVPAEVAKSWPCSTGVYSRANLLFHLPSGACPSQFSSMAGTGWTSTSNITFRLSEDLDYWFQPFRNFLLSVGPSLCNPFH